MNRKQSLFFGIISGLITYAIARFTDVSSIDPIVEGTVINKRIKNGQSEYKVINGLVHQIVRHPDTFIVTIKDISNGRTLDVHVTSEDYKNISMGQMYKR